MPIMHVHLTLSSSANIGTIENTRSGLWSVFKDDLVSSIETAKRILLPDSYSLNRRKYLQPNAPTVCVI